LTARSRLACALLALGCAAADAQQLAGDAADQRSRLIAQKLRLVESLIDSPAARRSALGGEAGTPALLHEGRRLLQLAREALAAERHDDAGSALDAALRNAAKASARLSAQPGALSTSAQQASHASLIEQVATYRAALQEVGGAGAGEARQATGRIDALRREAAALADGGRLGEANRQLGAAYRYAVETLSRLRAGQTVVLGLDFATPADEYAYERRRFDSSEILVGMMTDEGRADGERRATVDGFRCVDCSEAVAEIASQRPAEGLGVVHHRKLLRPAPRAQ
jgi:hypothetical protein